jgi:hypothetical protein
MNVHESQVEELLAEGYVVVHTEHYENVRDERTGNVLASFTRVDMMRAEDTCLHDMGHGDVCVLAKGHRGKKHGWWGNTYWCDGTHKARVRGTPHVYDEDVSLCWFCAMRDRHAYIDAMYAAYENDTVNEYGEPINEGSR